MSTKKAFFIIILLTITALPAFLTAQSVVNNISKSLGEIEIYLYENPPAGKAALLNLLNANPSMPDSSRAMIYSKLAAAYGMLNQLDSGIDAINRALGLYSDKNIKKASGLRTRALLLRLKGDYAGAESAIRKSLSLNDSLWKNKALKAITLQEYASIRSDQNDYYRATQLYLDAIDIVSAPDYEDPDDFCDEGKIRINLAEHYARTGNHPYAIRIFQEVLPQLEASKDYDGYIRTGYHFSEALIKTNQFSSADSLLNKLMPVCRSMENTEVESYLLTEKGLCLSGQKKYREAIPLFRQAFSLMEKNNSPFILGCALPYLSALKKTEGREEALAIMNSELVQSALKQAGYEEQLNYKRNAIHFIWQDLSPDKRQEYYEEIQVLSDSARAAGDRQLALELQAKYQLEQQEKSEQMLLRENDLLRQQAKFKKNQNYLILIIASLVVLSILLILLRIRQRSKIQSRKLEEQDKEIEFQKQRTAWAEQEKVYRDQLLEQQKILMTQTLIDSEDLKNKLNQLVEEKEVERRKEMLEQIEKAKDDKMGLEKLLIQFNSIHPTFASRLHNTYPKLSQSDLQFCILYRMNISTKDISTLLHIEPRSIYMKKYRILEKMGLGKEDDFDRIIFKG